MKKVIGLLVAIIMVMALAIPAYASSAKDYEKQYYEYLEKCHDIEDQMDARTARFHQDNPGVDGFILGGVYGAPGIYQDILGIFYKGYNGPGNYLKNGTTTFYWSDGRRGTAWQLYPDPKPTITQKYLSDMQEIQAEYDKYNRLSGEASVNRARALQEYIEPLAGYEEREDVCLIFQINNFLYAGGKHSIVVGEPMIEIGNYNAKPYVVNGNTMLPIRPLIEGLGGKVDWDKSLNGVRATLDDITITMPIGSEYAYINGNSVKMTTPAVVTNGKTMIPVRFVAENLGYEVEWVSGPSIVLIKYPKSDYVSDYSFNIPDSYNYTNTMFGYDFYKDSNTGVEVGLRLVETDIINFSACDDCTELFSSANIYGKIKIYDSTESNTVYILYENAHKALEISCYRDATEEDIENVQLFLATVIVTIEPVFNMA